MGYHQFIHLVRTIHLCMVISVLNNVLSVQSQATTYSSANIHVSSMKPHRAMTEVPSINIRIFPLRNVHEDIFFWTGVTIIEKYIEIGNIKLNETRISSLWEFATTRAILHQRLILSSLFRLGIQSPQSSICRLGIYYYLKSSRRQCFLSRYRIGRRGMLNITITKVDLSIVISPTGCIMEYNTQRPVGADCIRTHELFIWRDPSSWEADAMTSS